MKFIILLIIILFLLSCENNLTNNTTNIPSEMEGYWCRAKFIENWKIGDVSYSDTIIDYTIWKDNYGSYITKFGNNGYNYDFFNDSNKSTYSIDTFPCWVIDDSLYYQNKEQSDVLWGLVDFNEDTLKITFDKYDSINGDYEFFKSWFIPYTGKIPPDSWITEY